MAERASVRDEGDHLLFRVPLSGAMLVVGGSLMSSCDSRAPLEAPPAGSFEKPNRPAVPRAARASRGRTARLLPVVLAVALVVPAAASARGSYLHVADARHAIKRWEREVFYGATVGKCSRRSDVAVTCAIRETVVVTDPATGKSVSTPLRARDRATVRRGRIRVEPLDGAIDVSVGSAR